MNDLSKEDKKEGAKSPVKSNTGRNFAFKSSAEEAILLDGRKPKEVYCPRCFYQWPASRKICPVCDHRYGTIISTVPLALIRAEEKPGKPGNSEEYENMEL